MNVQHIAYNAETTIGISVFFNEGVSMDEKEAFRDAVIEHGGIKEITYKSADEAWEDFKMVRDKLAEVGGIGKVQE